MARSRYCRICKGFHDLEQAWPVACAGHFGSQSVDPGFYVISDTMDAVLNHADGRMYDSKSRYTRAVKAAGCEIVGNERMTPREAARPPVNADIRRAIEQLNSR